LTSDELRRALLTRLQRVEKIVRADLLAQYRANPALLARALARLREEENDVAGKEAWLEIFAGRAAVIYILKSLYVRVLEDQRLLATARIRDGGTYSLFRTLFPQLGHAAYLRTVFTEGERALPDLFARTPVEIAEPNEASAQALWSVWQEASPGGGPLFDFRDNLDTRFIGDLYQDLDPDVQKRYALLQTPHFIEAFILDRTLEPALAEFGLPDFRIIDPTCGSGHFLLGAFERLFRAWSAELGGGDAVRWEAASRALDAVYGADLNEYACALSRFRLLLGVVAATGERDLARLRTLHPHVLACDSLIPWERISREMLPGTAGVSWLARYGSDAERERNEAFFARGFHAVVGNPPYISVQDKKKREDYKRAWPRSASGKYSLSAPMTERFLLLPVPGGRAGLIVANNFCKREFGKGVVEKALRDVRIDLVVDSSGAYIPGHGTPTVMLFGTQTRVDLATHTALVVAGKRGEPREPSVPAQGLVWSSIAAHWDQRGFEDTWIAVQRLPQATLVKHPWSLGSDAVTALKAKLDAFPRVTNLGADAGPAVIIIEDEAFLRRYARALPLRSIVFGEDVRDWRVSLNEYRALVPYDMDSGDLLPDATAIADLWPMRSLLRKRGTFGSTFDELGLPWWSYRQYIFNRLGSLRSRIVIGEVATNAQFVYDASDAIFTQTAPVLTIRGATEARYRDVAAVLNSSSLEFWFKQVCFPKGDADGRTANAPFERRFARNGTNVLEAPLPYHDHLAPANDEIERALIFAALKAALEGLAESSPSRVFAAGDRTGLETRISAAQQRTETLRERLVALQEELDWNVYGAFGLLNSPPRATIDESLAVARGHRPFEIALARRIAAGDEESAWFTRHSLTPVTEIPTRYDGALRKVLEQRLALIENDPTIALLEQPVYKRRWTFVPWETMLREDARTWLLDRLDVIVRETQRMFTANDLVARLREDPKTAAIAGYAKGERDLDLADTIARLLTDEAVPDNPARLLKPSGLAKLVGTQTADLGPSGVAPQARAFEPGEPVNWKRVWRLQEREDAGDSVTVAVPPPFKNVDYAHPNGWRIRGKFNVANERFVVYDELTPKRYAWGGWTVAERARLSSEAFDLRDRELDGASHQPTLDDPRRCGIQFPLWDKVDELRRTSDPAYEDVKMLAEICGRACPCDVLERWRASASARRDAPAKSSPPKLAAEPRLAIDPALVAAALVEVGRAGATGIALAALEPLFGGDRSATTAAFDELRSSGRIEAFGRGRRQRYRVPEAKLFS